MKLDPDKAFRSWAKLLNPETLRLSLVRASIYLTAYELLHQALIEHLEGFFADGMNENGHVLGEEYRREVSSLHAIPFFASAMWFRKQGAITDEDLANLKAIRDHRNFIAHNIPQILGDADVEIDTGLLRSIRGIVGKIDGWWIREIEITTSPDFHGGDLDSIAQGSFSLRMAILDLLLEVASGDDTHLRQLYEAFVAGKYPGRVH